MKVVFPTHHFKWIADPKFSDSFDSFSNAFGFGAGVEKIFDPL